jgi:hypothetical protein
MSVRTLIVGLGLAATILMAQPSRQPAPAGAITVDYPAANSIFPPDLVPPTIEWRDADPRAKLWVIEFAFADGAKPVRVKSPGPRLQLGPIDERCAKAGAVTPTLTPNQEAGHAWKADAGTWSEVKKHGVTQPVTVRLLGFEDDKSEEGGLQRANHPERLARPGGRSRLLPRRAADPVS